MIDSTLHTIVYVNVKFYLQPRQ